MNKKLIVTIIAILIIFITTLSIYKFGNYNKKINTHYFNSNEINKYRYETNNNEA